MAIRRKQIKSLEIPRVADKRRTWYVLQAKVPVLNNAGEVEYNTSAIVSYTTDINGVDIDRFKIINLGLHERLDLENHELDTVTDTLVARPPLQHEDKDLLDKPSWINKDIEEALKRLLRRTGTMRR